MGQPSENAIAGIDYTELCTKLIDSQIDRILELVGKAGSKLTNEVRYRLTDVFREYMKAALAKYGTTKTFLYRNEPVPLYDFYVPLDLKNEKGGARAADIISTTKLGRLLVVTGLAGIGKSTFLKHLLLDAIKQSAAIPIFIELRHLNSGRLDLREHVVDVVRLGAVKLPGEFIERAFEAGDFILLLDAYDELTAEVKDGVRKGIHLLADRYPKLRIVLSSRPDDEFVGWAGFAEYRASPLSKQQALALVEKLDYDKEVKARFIRELDRALYKDHESFLSNPLLLTIMLLTYRDNAEIPKKKHLFFSQVFLTLYSQHDALKEGYKRPIKSGLALDDFQRVLAAVSIQSYLEGSITFGRERALAYIGAAKDVVELKFSAEDFLEDLLKAVCLLMQDGLFVSYTHRQFQEYYSALFINSAPSTKQRRLIERAAPGHRPNDLIKILHELSPDLTEKKFVLPALRAMLKRCKYDNKIDDAFLKRYIRIVTTGVVLRNGSIGYYVDASDIWDLARFVRSAYSGIVSQRVTPGDLEGKALREYVQQKGLQMPDGAKVVKIDSMDSDPAFFRALKSTQLFHPDRLKYLIDVRDFLEMRQNRRTQSIDALLK